MKSGVKTTEFWLTVAATLLASIGGVFASTAWGQVALGVSATLVAAGYTFARTSAKNTAELAKQQQSLERTAELQLRLQRTAEPKWVDGSSPVTAASLNLAESESGRARVRTLVAIALLGLLCMGCLGPSPKQTYVEGDQRTYEAIAPEYLAYSAADPNKTESQKENDKRVIRSWFLRIDAERKALLGDK